MLEMLLITATLFGNQESFNKSTEAYYKYSGLDKTIEKFGQENPELSFVLSTIGVVKQKKLYYQIYGPWFHEVDLNNDNKHVAWFKKEF